MQLNNLDGFKQRVFQLFNFFSHVERLFIKLKPILICFKFFLFFSKLGEDMKEIAKKDRSAFYEENAVDEIIAIWYANCHFYNFSGYLRVLVTTFETQIETTSKIIPIQLKIT